MARLKWLNLFVIFSLLFQVFVVPVHAQANAEEGEDILLEVIEFENEMTLEWKVLADVETTNIILSKNEQEIVLASSDVLVDADANSYRYVDQDLEVGTTYTYSIKIESEEENYQSNEVTYLYTEQPVDEELEAEEEPIAQEEEQLEDTPTTEETIETEEIKETPELALTSEEKGPLTELNMFSLEDEPSLVENHHQYDRDQAINIYDLLITDESIDFEIDFDDEKVYDFLIYVNGKKVDHNYFTITGLNASTTYDVKIQALTSKKNILSERVYTLTTSKSSEEEAVTIVDRNLEKALRDALGIQKRALTQTDLEKIKTLDASSYGITNLAGLEYAVNVQTLHLYDNKISNLTPLAALTSLRILDLDANRMKDLTPLAGLDKLEDLWVQENQLVSIKPLLGLKNLDVVYLVNNRFDLTAGSEVRRDIAALQDEGVSIIYDLNDQFWIDYYSTEDSILIEWELPMSSSDIYSYELYLDGKKWTELDRDNLAFEFKNLDPKTEYEIEIFSIDENGDSFSRGIVYVETKSVPSGETVVFEDSNLEQLVRHTLRIQKRDLFASDLAELDYLSNWEDELFITSLKGLEHATNLSSLSLVGVEIDDYTPIQGLANLEELELSYSGIRDLTFLEGMSNLRYLSLYGNEIEDPTVLLRLPHLESVNLWGNPIDPGIGSAATKVLDQLEKEGVYVDYSRPWLMRDRVTDASIKVEWGFDEFIDLIDTYQVVVNDRIYEKLTTDEYAYLYMIRDLKPETDYTIQVFGLKNGKKVLKTEKISVTTNPVPTGDDVRFVDLRV